MQQAGFSFLWFILMFQSWKTDTNDGHNGAQQNSCSHGYEGHLHYVDFDVW
jgi:hypothetical protein